MFTHFDDPGKCEWLGGGLDAFMRHYNEQCGTAYALTDCLDVVRVSGTTPKEPEVLLTDANTARQMVIERKSVVWPHNYIHQHQLEHDFAKLIWQEVQGFFRDAAYRLSVDVREFRGMSGKKMKVAGHEIGEEVARLTPSDLPVRRAKPIHWSFRKAFPEEFGERKGIVVIHEKRMTFEDFDDGDAKVGTSSKMQFQINAAASKFERYATHQKLVLLDFYGDSLCEDNIRPLLEGISIPESIDEIWRTVRDWISEDDYEIGYDRLFKR